MTYFEFLLRYLVIPILLLFGIYLWRKYRYKLSLHSDNEKTAWFAIAVHVTLALIYTTPWDNYLVATGVWHYNPALVTGIVFGYVPLEEYIFFVLETLFVGLWWFLMQKVASPVHFKPSSKVRFWSSAVLLILWIFSIIIFFSAWKPGTYLSITLLWALPPIILQCAFGADVLWHHRKLLLATVLPISIYLSFVDSLAISATTWTIDPVRSTGLFIGKLPLEEGVFFLITVILITFGVTLMKATQSQERIRNATQKWAT